MRARTVSRDVHLIKDCTFSFSYANIYSRTSAKTYNIRGRVLFLLGERLTSVSATSDRFIDCDILRWKRNMKYIWICKVQSQSHGPFRYIHNADWSRGIGDTKKIAIHHCGISLSGLCDLNRLSILVFVQMKNNL